MSSPALAWCTYAALPFAFGFASSTPEAPSAAIALGALFILAYAVTLFIDLFRIGGKVERFNLNLLK